VERLRLRLLGLRELRAARRRPPPPAARLFRVDALGPLRPRALDHGVLEQRPRLHGHRRSAVRYVVGRQRRRKRPALALEVALAERLRGAPPLRLLVSWAAARGSSDSRAP